MDLDEDATDAQDVRVLRVKRRAREFLERRQSCRDGFLGRLSSVNIGLNETATQTEDRIALVLPRCSACEILERPKRYTTAS